MNALATTKKYLLTLITAPPTARFPRRLATATGRKLMGAVRVIQRVHMAVPSCLRMVAPAGVVRVSMAWDLVPVTAGLSMIALRFGIANVRSVDRSLVNGKASTDDKVNGCCYNGYTGCL